MNQKTKKLKLPKIPKNWEEDYAKLPYVKLTWIDATTHDGWWSYADLKNKTPIRVQTFGYFFPPARHFFRIAPTLASHGMLADPWLIPRSWVQSIKVLRGA